jgi:hypothetical protein
VLLVAEEPSETIRDSYRLHCEKVLSHEEKPLGPDEKLSRKEGRTHLGKHAVGGHSTAAGDTDLFAHSTSQLLCCLGT